MYDYYLEQVVINCHSNILNACIVHEYIPRIGLSMNIPIKENNESVLKNRTLDMIWSLYIRVI